MTDLKNGVDEHGNPIPTQTPPEAVKKPGTDGGETPDTTERLKALEEQNANYQAAMKEERQKRQEAQGRIAELETELAGKNKPDGEEELDEEFDPEEIETFKKISKKLGIVYKSDLEAEKALEQQKRSEQQNLTVMSDFVSQHTALFGTAENATPEQEANWKAFTSYLSEVHDITKQSLPAIKNLDKKLAAALRDLSKDATITDLKERARLDTLVEQRNADLLAVGAGGAGNPPEEGWSRRTPKSVVVDNLRMAGYSEKEIEEMTAKK